MRPEVPGYHGGYLRIDVSDGTSTRIPLEPQTLRQYLGGSGLGVAILLHERAAEADPLSPAAPIAFVFSPLVGSPLTTSAKFAVVSKSPLTNRINDSLASSGFALAGKKTGYDSIVIVGQAQQPSILVIDDDRVRLVKRANGRFFTPPSRTMEGMQDAAAVVQYSVQKISRRSPYVARIGRNGPILNRLSDWPNSCLKNHSDRRQRSIVNWEQPRIY